ncbi:initiator tRNA phosphoribosyl transferase [Clavulina sp. PMI_390]|nr:initiator tRNA phosphoribosyl transferase [Clavulina sp. PMI_390]
MASASLIEEIRKEKTSTHNRLHSIDEDARFVKLVSEAYPKLPVIANQRCGAWYVDPDDSHTSHEWAYFKSTDGHHGRWTFSLRRANLHLLPVIDRSSGIIIVDSTRRGKRFPDALSKTIPIWCAVINRALRMLYHEDNQDWDDALYTSPKAVSESEHEQIKQMVSSWAKELTASTFNLHRLRRPLRPLWLSPNNSTFPQLPDGQDEDFLPVICLSASKLIEQDGGIERRSGYTYVQGSGDDHELWSRGLGPPLFWKHQAALLAANPSDLGELLDEIVLEGKQNDTSTHEHLQSFPIGKAGNQIVLVLSSTANTTPPALAGSEAAITITDAAEEGENKEETESLSKQVLCMDTTSTFAKRRDLLPFFRPPNLDRAVDFARLQVRDQGRTLKIFASSSTDEEMIGVALILLQSLYDNEGALRSEGNDNFTTTKDDLRMRLQWIQASASSMNPSRAVLKLVNSYFMSPR